MNESPKPLISDKIVMATVLINNALAGSWLLLAAMQFIDQWNES